MSNQPVSPVISLSDVVQAKSQGFIDELKGQRNAAQDKVAELAGVNASIQKALELARQERDLFKGQKDVADKELAAERDENRNLRSQLQEAQRALQEARDELTAAVAKPAKAVRKRKAGQTQ